MELDKTKTITSNIVSENIRKIKELFPNCVIETKDKNENTTLKIDFETLKQELSDDIIGENQEKYEFTWTGKKASILLSNQPTDKILVPCKDESVNWDTTQNLYIEGDNLEVLKILRSTYFHKVKLIYIDPPYNTGKDFIYKDDYKKNVKEYLYETNQIDKEGNHLVQNKETNGRFHTDWLNMMYPRLKLARDFLTDDGAIFISIDDHELHNIRKICDEVFGEENFVACIVNQSANSVFGTKSSSKYKTFIKTKDYIIVYKSRKIQLNPLYVPSKSYIYFDHDFIYENGRSYSTLNWFKLNYSKIFEKFGLKINKLNIQKIMNFDDNIKNEIINRLADIQYSTSPYTKNDLSNQEEYSLSCGEIISHNGLKLIKENKGKGITRFCRSLKESCKIKNGKLLKCDILGDVWNTASGYGNINFEGSIKFPNGKKPLILLHNIISSLDMKDDIILDFFSGSATTAHAVMQLNAEDGGNRKFIMVQLPEPCNEKSEAFKEGYKNICEIGKERIRRAGKKIIEETGKTDLDIGFRVLKLDSSL